MYKLPSLLIVLLLLSCTKNIADESPVLVHAQLVSIEKMALVNDPDKPPVAYRQFFAKYKINQLFLGQVNNSVVEVVIYWHYAGVPDELGSQVLLAMEWSSEERRFVVNGSTIVELTALTNGTLAVCDPNRNRIVLLPELNIRNLDAVGNAECEQGVSLPEYAKYLSTQYKQ